MGAALTLPQAPVVRCGGFELGDATTHPNPHTVLVTKVVHATTHPFYCRVWKNEVLEGTGTRVSGEEHVHTAAFLLLRECLLYPWSNVSPRRVDEGTLTPVAHRQAVKAVWSGVWSGVVPFRVLPKYTRRREVDLLAVSTPAVPLLVTPNPHSHVSNVADSIPHLLYPGSGRVFSNEHRSPTTTVVSHGPADALQANGVVGEERPRACVLYATTTVASHGPADALQADARTRPNDATQTSQSRCEESGHAPNPANPPQTKTPQTTLSTPCGATGPYGALCWENHKNWKILKMFWEIIKIFGNPANAGQILKIFDNS